MTHETLITPVGGPNASFASASAKPFQVTGSALGLSGPWRQLMKTLLSEGRPQICNAAKMAGVSVRTLQRRLSSQGLSYSDLVQQARCEIAFDLLANSDTKIIDVALETGYKDASNFTRAFRRFSGMSPRQFRKRGHTSPVLAGLAAIGGTRPTGAPARCGEGGHEVACCDPLAPRFAGRP